MNAPATPLNLDELLAAISAGLVPKWCFFWGHAPAQDGSITKSCLSQWWEGYPFVLDGITYATAEHWMMAEKARLFGDDETRAKILAAAHPHAAKKLGRQVKGFDENLWCSARWDIVTRGNAAKFGQYTELGEFLLATGDRILVEASPHDHIWGIGLAATDALAEKPAEWRGLNLLGFALMAVRDHHEQHE
jgi:ribA/ribD-fused uncharacterized protein